MLKEGYNGKGDEEKNVSNYWTTLRKMGDTAI
jgi:hypothetical protein